MVRWCDCLVRIRIDPSKVEIIPPADLPCALQIPHWMFARLIASGLAMGANPSDWRASIQAIPVSAFIGAEFAFETHPIHWLHGRVLTRSTASGLAVLVQT
jgi:hypothetical protein